MTIFWQYDRQQNVILTFDTWIKEKVWDTPALYLWSRSSCGQCKPISSALCKVHCWNRHVLGTQWSKAVCYRQAEKKEQKEKKFKPLWIGVSFIAVKMQPRRKNKETELKIATTKTKKSLPKKKTKERKKDHSRWKWWIGKLISELWFCITVLYTWFQYEWDY